MKHIALKEDTWPAETAAELSNDGFPTMEKEEFDGVVKSLSIGPAHHTIAENRKLSMPSQLPAMWQLSEAMLSHGLRNNKRPVRRGTR
jgi:hypothetical protein